jgi:hypothetical protein
MIIDNAADGKGAYAAFPLQFWEVSINLLGLFRYTVLAISAAAMCVGIMVMIGWLVPRNFPGQYRVILGAVVLLYGLYRFVIAYQKPRDRSNENP